MSTQTMLSDRAARGGRQWHTGQWQEVTGDKLGALLDRKAQAEARAILERTEPIEKALAYVDRGVSHTYTSGAYFRLDSGHGMAWMLAESIAAVLPILEELEEASHARA